MKSTIIALLLAIIAIGALPACKKCFSCTYASGNSASYCENHPYTSAQLTTLDTDCVHAGGSWTHSNI